MIFETAYETRKAIRNELQQAAREAKDVQNLFNKINNPGLPGGFNNSINFLQADEFNAMSSKLSNSLTLIAEYIRDLKKFDK